MREKTSPSSSRNAPLGKRRLYGKQLAPIHFVLPSAAVQAIADEAWSELTALHEDKRRRHIHWVHARTHQAEHRQPSTFTRAQWWQHLRKVYREVYPEPANETGSILLFGLVCKERHRNSPREAEREEHTHAATYSSVQHYWRAVAAHSLRVYKVKMHAACHEGYTSMYTYLRCPSPKKPLSELDTAPFFSRDHPLGDLLQRLLKAGAAAERGQKKRRGAASGDGAGGEASETRFRGGDIYALALNKNIRTSMALKVHAQMLASQGNPQLAEFCTVRCADLQQLLDSAWSVHEAPRQSLVADGGRMATLRAATQQACVCSGVWIPGAAFVLHNNRESVPDFCSDVAKAFLMGARRGVNLAIIGGPGMGKSMLFESLDEIFVVAGKPERDNSFPLASVLGAEVLLWQEFSWDKKMCAFEDLLSLLVGERLGVRVPGARPVSHRNRAPMFYTARRPLSMFSRDPSEMADFNHAMAERFKTRVWTTPLPRAGRIPDFPRCGHCFAQFILNNASAPAPAVPLQIAAPMPAAAVIAAPMPAAAVLPLAL